MKSNVTDLHKPADPYLLKSLTKNAYFHANKFVLAISHCFFLSSCLEFGVAPKILTHAIPTTGMPKFIADKIKTFNRQATRHTLHILLQNYHFDMLKHRSELHAIYNCFKNLNLVYLIDKIELSISHKRRIKQDMHLKKLSKILLDTLKREGFIERNPIHDALPPLVDFAPPLATIFQLPQPQVPLSPHFTQLSHHLPSDVIIPTSYLTQPAPHTSTANISNTNTNQHTNNKNNENILLTNRLSNNDNNIIIDNNNTINNNIVNNNNTQDSTSSNYIFNLSNIELSKHEISLLNKGLSFCPTPRFDHFSLVKDVQAFVRNVRWRYELRDKVIDNNIAPHLLPFKPPSNLDPPPLPPQHAIERFSDCLLDFLAQPKLPLSLNHHSNITPEERKALSSLKQRSDLVIMPPDKGSGTVILNCDDYISKVLQLLDDPSTYEPQTRDLSLEHTQKIRNFLNSHGPAQNLRPKEIELLTPQDPRTSRIYALIKVHKTGSPGRPIVSSYGCPTERISAFVDHFLQPLVKQLPAYIKDTNHFLDCINSFQEPLPLGTFLVTIDVTSLYTNITHQMGLEAIEFYLQRRPLPHVPHTFFLLKLTEFVLTCNNFHFMNAHYLQKQGTAMGTKMAPSYANLTMGRLENNFLNSQPKKPLMWRRFIDDIFMIWTHSEEELNIFLQNLNSFSPLKFTYERSLSKATFLDVDLTLSEGRLCTSIHIKNTNKLQYLHFTSCHPPKAIRSIPYSLALRATRIPNTEGARNEYLNILSSALKNRGYPSSFIQTRITQAKYHQPKTPTNSDTNRLPLVTTYYPGIEPILRKALKLFTPILHSDPTTNDLLPNNTPIAFKQPPNLRKLLTHTDPSPRTPRSPPGCAPCNNCARSDERGAKCSTCKNHDTSTTFTSPTTNLSYPIFGSNSCLSRNAIYQLTCKHLHPTNSTPCNAFYIGMTTTSIRQRMNGHRSDIKYKRVHKPVAEHASFHNSTSFEESFSIKTIRQLPPDLNFSSIRQWEIAHQLILQSRQNPGALGLNIR